MSQAKNTSAGLEFKSRVTKKALQLSLVPFLVGLYLCFLGVQYHRQFAMADATRWPFVLGPIAFGGTLIGFMLIGTKKQLAKKITITRSHLVYDEGDEDKNFNVAWKSMVYSAPSNEKQMVRTLLVASQDRQASLHDMFVPEFTKMVAEIKKRKNMAVTDSGGHAVIDSGKIRMLDGLK